MLTELQIQNFKSWADTGRMRMAPLTAYFGPNSSGKTSILQLLLLLKQTVESTDRAEVLHLGDERSYVDLGTFGDILHKQGAPEAMAWSLTWTGGEVRDSQAAPAQDGPSSLSFSARISGAGEPIAGRPMVDCFRYDLVADSPIFRFAMRRIGNNYSRYEFASTGWELQRPKGRPPFVSPPVKCYGFPPDVLAYDPDTHLLSAVQLQFERLFGRVYHLGPLRELPGRQSIWGGSRPSDVGRRGERVVDALLAGAGEQATISRGKGKKRRSLEEVVAGWLKELRLACGFRVRPVAEGSNLYRVYVQRDRGGPEVLLSDVGFGVSQILPVITLCYYVPEGSIIILEQPEIHLHPVVQAGLADVLIDATKTRNVQIIVESHSEHLLRRLQRRIAEEKVPASDVALYFCSMSGNGVSALTTLHLDEYGNISNWPQGFFGDEMGELAAAMEAEAARRMAAAGG